MIKNGTYQSHLFWGNNRNSYWKWGLYLSSSINRYQKKSPNWQCDKVEKYTATWVIFVDTYHLFKGTIEPATPLKFNMETWSLKSPGKGDSELGKPSLSGSMLRFGEYWQGTLAEVRTLRHHPFADCCAQPTPSVDLANGGVPRRGDYHGFMIGLCLCIEN